MTIELLRDTLQHHADEAPPSTGLVEAIRTRSRRRHRRRVTTAVLAAATVTLVAVGTVAVVRATGPAPPADPTGSDTLVPPSYELPTFPFTPGWVPRGYGEPHYSVSPAMLTRAVFEGTAAGHTELRHFPAGEPVSYSSAGPYLAVAVHGGDPGPHFAPIEDELAEQAVTVRGQDATLYTGRTDESAPEEVADNRVAMVSWLDRPGRWVTVSGVNGFGVDDVIRYAEELVEQPLPAQAPFTFDLTPPELEVKEVTPQFMSFVPRGGGREYELGGLGVTFARDALAISIHTAGSASYVGCVDPDTGEIVPIPPVPDDRCVEPAREPVQVAGRLAELVGGETLILPIDGNLELWVTAKGTLALSREDLIRLATGIHLTPYAQPDNHE